MSKAKQPRFPAIGFMAWCLGYGLWTLAAVSCVFVGSLDHVGFLYLSLCFTFFMLVGGMALFLGSDYAQQKWNPSGE